MTAPSNSVTSASEVRSGPFGSAGSSASRIWALARRPRMWIPCPITVRVAAVDDQVEVVPAFGRDPPRDRQVGLGQQGGDPFVDQLRLDRVFLVDEDFDFGRAGGQGRERVDLVDQVGGQDQRRQDVTGADLFEGFVPVFDRDALDATADPAAHPGRRQLLAADADPGVRRGLR